MKLTKEELNVLMVALDHMQEYLDDLSLEPMSEIFDLDSKYKVYESLRRKLIGKFAGSAPRLKEDTN
jgi:hypothetical protein